MRDMEPASEDMEPASESEMLLAQIEIELRRPWWHIAFSDAVETFYRDATEPSRVAHFSSLILLSLLMFNLFIFPERLLMPDAFGAAKISHFGIVTPLVLFVVWLMRRGTIRSTAAAMLFVFAVVIGTLSVAMMSRDPHSVLMVFCIPMVLIFLAVFPLSFRAALIVGLGSSVLACAEGMLHPCFDEASRLLAFAVIVSLLIFTVVATYRLETTERRSYLLTLAETTRTQILAARNQILRDLSNSDGLTGLGNRRLFDATLERLWIEHAETKTPVALAMIDVDNFKTLNDVLGHLGGDRCLCGVAEILKGFARDEMDFVFRFGGDEFGVLLSGAECREVARISERIRAAVEHMRTDDMASAAEASPRTCGVTVSIGHATAVPVLGVNPATLIAAADQALYLAKQQGRNRIQPGPFWAAQIVRNVA